MTSRRDLNTQCDDHCRACLNNRQLATNGKLYPVLR